MRTFILTAVLAFTGMAVAAPIDGKWTGEIKRGGKTESKAAVAVFDFKAEGNTLKGTVALGKKGSAVEIHDGTIDGDEFSFSTIVKGKKGERTVRWKGTLKADQIELTQSAGKKNRARGGAITLKRTTPAAPPAA